MAKTRVKKKIDKVPGANGSSSAANAAAPTKCQRPQQQSRAGVKVKATDSSPRASVTKRSTNVRKGGSKNEKTNYAETSVTNDKHDNEKATPDDEDMEEDEGKKKKKGASTKETTRPLSDAEKL